MDHQFLNVNKIVYIFLINSDVEEIGQDLESSWQENPYFFFSENNLLVAVFQQNNN